MPPRTEWIDFDLQRDPGLDRLHRSSVLIAIDIVNPKEKLYNSETKGMKEHEAKRSC